MSAAKKISAGTFARVSTEAELIREISRVISELTGVQLGEKQHSLVQGRLAKRLRELKLNTPIEYAKYLTENEAIELGVLTSLLTTHHTYFFREFSHFEFLLKQTLPAVIRSHEAKGLDTIRIWSAACSRGQEVYSLAMFLKHHLPQIAPRMKFEILGSDICEESVGIAKNGVYGWEEVKSVPTVYLQGNWMRGTGDIANFVRAKDDIHKNVRFQIVNLMDVTQSFPAAAQPRFDIIFCRNVFIYFTHQQIQAITKEFIKLLNPDGHLFIGLSESLNGLDLPVEWVGPSVYLPTSGQNRKKEEKPTLTVTRSVPQSSGQAPSPKIAQAVSSVTTWVAPKLRVLCVDDSPTVLALLKKVLTPEKGFEVIGTASDGEEAAEKARALKPDVITLDIHMPKLSGQGYLEKHHQHLKIPVVMVSSVSREDSGLAFRCLELGASDYVEKPSLQNLVQLEEELSFKLRSAKENGSRILEIDSKFKRSPMILKPETKLRLIISGFGTRDQVIRLLKEFKDPQPATIVLMESAGDVFKQWVTKVAAGLSGAKSSAPASAKGLQPNSIWFGEMNTHFDLVRTTSQGLQVSILAPGPLSPGVMKNLVAFCGSRKGLNTNIHLVIEDRGPAGASITKDIESRADQIAPLTSFSYESERFLAEGGGK